MFASRSSGDGPAISSKAVAIALIAFMVSGLALVQAAPALANGTTISVTTGSDVTNANDNACSLREAITAANTNTPSGNLSIRPMECAAGSAAEMDIIAFDGGFMINLSGELPAISSDLQIIGGGMSHTIIQGGASYRVLTVTSTGNVALFNLSIRNGQCTGACAAHPNAGGNLVNESGTLRLHTVNVSHGKAGTGGGIMSYGGTLIIESGSVISDNETTGSGSGGGIYVDAGSLSITASTVTTNSAGAYGGGIYNNGAATIQTSSRVSSNEGAYGGGIYNAASGALTATGTRFLYNKTAGEGGAIYNDNNTSSAIDITASCVTGNDATAVYNHVAAGQVFTGNWWGSSTGPGAVGPSAHGDTVSVNVDYSGYLTSPMTGCGNNPAPYVTVSPATLNFPGQLVGTPGAAKTVTVTNASNLDLQVGTLATSGDFALSNDTCTGQIIELWGTCTFDVTFTATATGTRTGSVQIPSDAWNSPTAVSLKGTGLASLTAPMPKSPKDGAAVYKPPKLSWKGTKGTLGFHVELDNDSDFSSVEQVADLFNSSYSVATLPYGIYYWHVATRDLFSQGTYSATYSFEMTINKAPKKNALLKTGIVKFGWMAVKGKTYSLQVYTDDSSEPARSGSVVLTQSGLTKAGYSMPKTLPPLVSGNYYWRVSVDGGATWTPGWKFTVK